ncbi:MAG: FeoB-associated Cys-rich membrane protein [Clostridia bacterium]
MVEFLTNNWGSLVIGIVAAAVIVWIAVGLYRNRKKGKSSCGCGCGHCPSSGICHKK